MENTSKMPSFFLILSHQNAFIYAANRRKKNGEDYSG